MERVSAQLAVQRYLDQYVEGFQDCSVADIKKRFPPQKANKADFVMLARRMLGISQNVIVVPEVNPLVVIKTVRLTGNEKPAESMVFQKIDFTEWCGNIVWHETKTYKFFANTFLAMFVYQQYPAGKRVADEDMIFKGIKVVKIPDYDLDHGIQDMRNEVRRLVNQDQLEVTETRNSAGQVRRFNNLPGISFNGICHLRPGGVNGEDMVALPNGQRIALQRFWLNSGYIKRLLEE